MFIVTGRDTVTGRDGEETIIVPAAVEKVLDQRHVALEFFVFPAQRGRIGTGLLLETVVGFDAHFDKRYFAVVSRHIAQLIVEEPCVVLAVLGD